MISRYRSFTKVVEESLGPVSQLRCTLKSCPNAQWGEMHRTGPMHVLCTILWRAFIYIVFNELKRIRTIHAETMWTQRHLSWNIRKIDRVSVLRGKVLVPWLKSQGFTLHSISSHFGIVNICSWEGVICKVCCISLPITDSSPNCGCRSKTLRKWKKEIRRKVSRKVSGNAHMPMYVTGRQNCKNNGMGKLAFVT